MSDSESSDEYIRQSVKSLISRFNGNNTEVTEPTVKKFIKKDEQFSRNSLRFFKTLNSKTPLSTAWE